MTKAFDEFQEEIKRLEGEETPEPKNFMSFVKLLSLSDSELKLLEKFIEEATGWGIPKKDVEEAFMKKEIPVPAKTQKQKVSMWKENVRLKLENKQLKKRISELEAEREAK